MIVFDDLGFKGYVEDYHQLSTINENYRARKRAEQSGYVFHCDSAILINDSGGADVEHWDDEELVIALFKIWMEDRREKHRQEGDAKARERAADLRRKDFSVVEKRA